MNEKVTRRVTLEDLAAMIERNIPHKEEFQRLENIATETLLLVKALPDRIREEILDAATLQRQLTEVRKVLREKFPDVHLSQ